MKATIIKMRRAGVLIPRPEIRHQLKWHGDLTIMDTRENGLNRIVKIARHVRGDPGPNQSREELYEPHVIWVNEERMVLAGFERVAHEGRFVDYAQSWLCMIGPEQWPI